VSYSIGQKYDVQMTNAQSQWHGEIKVAWYLLRKILMGSSPIVFIGSWLTNNVSLDLKMGSSSVALITWIRLGTLVYACPYLVGSIFWILKYQQWEQSKKLSLRALKSFYFNKSWLQAHKILENHRGAMLHSSILVCTLHVGWLILHHFAFGLA
jgi:hypothetical protein